MRKSSAPSLRNKFIPPLKSNEYVSNILPVTKEVKVSNQCRTTENILSLLEDTTQLEEENTQIEYSSNEEDISLKRKSLEDAPLAANNILIFSVVWGKKSTKKHKTWEGDGTLEINGKNGILKDVDGKILGRTNSIKTALESGAILSVGGKEVQLIDEIKSFVGIKQADPEQKNENPPKRARTGFMRKTLKLKSNISNPLIMQSPSNEHQWRMNENRLPLTSVSVDSFLVEHLRPHQREGVSFLYECVLGLRKPGCNGAILADEMGLGKTLQSITLLWTLLKQGPYGGRPVISRALIVTPSSLVENWNKEMNRWLGRLRLTPYVVNQKNRPENFPHSPSKQVMIISYEMFVRSYETINSITFDLLICDEGHRLKNPDTETHSLLRGLSCERRILLTGTPIQNDLHEFYALIDFINPGVLGSLYDFRMNFESSILRAQQPEASEEEINLGKEKASELNHLTNWFILRRTQKVINQYLPTKTELVLFCRPTEEQKYAYHLEVEHLDNLISLDDGHMHLKTIHNLKKICNHPGLIYGNINSETYTESSKMIILDILLKRLIKLKEKIVIVSYSTQTLEIISKFCDLKRYPHCRLEGSTPTSQRLKIVDKFNENNLNYFALLLSAKAGGVGLNLTGASHLVLFDSDWNPASDLQAMARIWRDGQKNDCHIYRFLTSGTIEEKIFQRQISKTDLSDAIVEPDNNSTVKMSKSELKDIFTFYDESLCITHDLLQCKCSGDGATNMDQIEGNETAIRRCQLGGNTLETKIKGINQLLSWEHFAPPFESGILRSLGIEEAELFISYIFRQKVT